jgi:nucleotide-binding universal stress UspA family protein
MIKVLLPIDFSKDSLTACKYAITLFGVEDISYCLFNAYKLPHAGASMLVSIEDILSDESKSGLEAFKQTLLNWADEGLDIGVQSEKGELVDCSNRYVKQNDVNFVVMGTKGADGLKEKLIGSNTWQAVQRMRIPVIVVPAQTEIKRPETIGIATDLSGVAALTLEPLFEIVLNSKAKLAVLNIGGDPKNSESYFKGGLVNIDHELYTSSGEDVVTELNDLAVDKGINFLAMVRHKQGFFDSIFKTSTTRAMSMHAHLPVMILEES